MVIHVRWVTIRVVLKGAEVNYSTYDRDLFGLRDSVLHVRHLSLGISFTVKTDHYSLRWLLQQETVTGQRLRWLAVFNECDITETQHLPGATNVGSDNLEVVVQIQMDLAVTTRCDNSGNMDICFSLLQQFHAFHLVRNVADGTEDITLVHSQIEPTYHSPVPAYPSN